MTLLTGCLPAELGDVAVSNCPENWGQTQKVLFFHLYTAAGARTNYLPNHVSSPINLGLIANWTTELGASNQTKMVPSPWLGEPVSEAGDAITFGGGNATPNGVSFVVGRNPQTFEAMMYSQAQFLTMNALKAFEKGSGGNGRSSIGVMLINSAGQIACETNGLALDAAALELRPIPIHALFISDKSLGGFEGVDYNKLSFQFLPNWSDTFYIITPSDFDALEDLVNS
jgi:hypothetical protein